MFPLKNFGFMHSARRAAVAEEAASMAAAAVLNFVFRLL